MGGRAWTLSDVTRGRMRSIGARLSLAYAASATITISLLFLVGYQLMESRLISGLDLLNRSEFQQIENHLGHDYAALTPEVVERRIPATTESASVLFYINIQSRNSHRLFLA